MSRKVNSTGGGVAPKSAADFLRQRTRMRPTLAMVLGSGFQQALGEFEVTLEIPYGRIPGFPAVGVSGHAGKLVLGHFGGTPVLILNGRTHFYEGGEMERVTFAVRVLAEFGVRAVLLTNAAGGINRKFAPGDFMALTDHINLMGTNPLRGADVPGRPRFVDLTQVYDPQLTGWLRKAAKQSKLRLHAGVYLAVSGPSYETPAEIRAFARLGADAVGMSTVPEATAARQCGLRVAAVSCITNRAASLGEGVLSHEEVLARGGRNEKSVAQFLKNFSQRYAESY